MNYSQTFTGVRKVYNNNFCRIDSFDSNATVVETRDKTSLKNPKWREQIRDGVNATTTFTASSYDLVNFSAGYVKVQGWSSTCNRITRQEIIGNIWQQRASCWGKPFLSLGETLADSRAKESFTSKATAVNQDFDGSTFIGELRESIHMLRNPALSLRRGIRAYSETVRKRTRRMMRGFDPKRPNPQTVKKVNKVVTDSWLEYQYGWRPLANDIENAYQAIGKISASFGIQEVTAVGVEDAASFLFDQLTDLGSTVYGQARTVQKVLVIYRAGIKKSTGRIKAPLEKWGISTSNFLPTLWELTPYSFLVDYFSNIGKIISAVSYPRSNVAWSNRTVVTYVDKAFNTTKVSGVPGVTNIEGYSPQSATHRLKTVSRTSYFGSFVPEIRFHLPGSDVRWANIGALLGSNKLFR